MLRPACQTGGQSRAREVHEATLSGSGRLRFEPPGQADDQGVSIEIAEDTEHKAAARRLIERRYAWRGYTIDHNASSRRASTTFITKVEGRPVGTLTLTIDSPAGLAADNSFGPELHALRQQKDRRLCELGRFAVETDLPSKDLLASLFHVVFVYGQRRFQCTDLLIEVNPRHRRFYETMLGFEPVGTLRRNHSVDAPAQLMRLEISRIRDMVDRHGGRNDRAADRSLYPFFFQPCREDEIFDALLDAIDRADDPASAADTRGLGPARNDASPLLS